MRTCRAAAFLFVLNCTLSAVSAEDWPEFRGPTQQGHSTATGLPLEWSTEKNIVWKAELPGRAWSSPIVIADKIFVTDAVGAKDSADPHDTFSLRVMSLSAVDGKTLWDTEVFVVENPHLQGIHGKNSYASPTPVFEKGKIYVHFGHFGTACLDEQGKILWKAIAVPYNPVHGNGGCPVIVDDLLIYTVDAAAEPAVVALEKATGKLRWKSPRKSDAKRTFSFCTPLLIQVNGQPQLICPGSNVVSALNPKDGSEIWKVRYEGYSVVPRPVYGHGLIFFSTGYDRPTLMAIKADGTGDVTDTHVAWKLDKGAPLTPSPLLVGDDLYLVADKGLVTCLDARSGTVHWQERVSRQTSASPIFAEGRLYIQDEQGGGFVIKAGHKLELLGESTLDDKSLASPAISGKHLIIRTEHALWCVGQKD
jgi:outer membrane protein assembly factor BamB